MAVFVRHHIVNDGRHWTKVAQIWYVLYYEWWHTSCAVLQGKEEHGGTDLGYIQGVLVGIDPCDISRNHKH